jgi:glycolate oxidase FAD binding subunit
VNTRPAAPEAVHPTTREAVAALLKRASDAGRSLVIRGAGTKMDWGRTPEHVDLVLEMRGLNRVLAHQHGDLTATIEAGATLREVNDTLSRHGQWLPLDPPFADRATIGGILATNDSGPLRHRFGTPRDLVIGVTLATTDGIITKAGGNVVKNVAGYDLSKLITGSFGSLAAIVAATFKLSPLPAASKTLLVEAADVGMVASIVRTVMASPLEPIAFEIVARPSRSAFAVLLQFASLPDVVDHQLEQAVALPALASCTRTIAEGDAERELWHRHATRVWDGPSAVVRASWLPSEITAVVGAIDVATAQARCAARAFVARAAVGSGLMAIDGDPAAQGRAIDGLRQSRHLGNVVVLRGSNELKALVDVWGSMGDRQALLASMKQAFDPQGVLNAGRGPL